MPSSATALVRLSSVVLREAVRLGANRAEVLRRAGLSKGDLRDPDRRIQVRKVLRLWRAVLDVLPEPEVGIRLAQGIEVRDIGLVGYLMLHSPSLGKALERLARFSHILDETYPPELRIEGDRVVYVSEPSLQPIAGMEPVADFEAVALLKLVRELTGQQLAPLEVVLPHLRPPADLGAYRRVFGAPVAFDPARLEMVFGRASLELPVAGSEEELGRYLEEHAENAIQALMPEGSVTEKAERALWAGIREGDTSLAKIAASLAMSQRSLQRSLRSEGTSFAELRDAIRRELAVSLLGQDDLAIYEIALLLGYSEPSTFYRAFRRWTDASPREFRLATEQQPGAASG